MSLKLFSRLAFSNDYFSITDSNRDYEIVTFEGSEDNFYMFFGHPGGSEGNKVVEIIPNFSLEHMLAADRVGCKVQGLHWYVKYVDKNSNDICELCVRFYYKH